MGLLRLLRVLVKLQQLRVAPAAVLPSQPMRQALRGWGRACAVTLSTTTTAGMHRALPRPLLPLPLLMRLELQLVTLLLRQTWLRVAGPSAT